MAEKYTYGPLVYNCFGEEDDSGNYWWSGNPPVGYEQESGVFRMPVDENGNQCLPGDCILHPNCTVQQFVSDEPFSVPSLTWCREWFSDNFLQVTDWDLARYALRWIWWNNQHSDEWKQFSQTYRTQEEKIKQLWPDVHR